MIKAALLSLLSTLLVVPYGSFLKDFPSDLLNGDTTTFARNEASLERRAKRIERRISVYERRIDRYERRIETLDGESDKRTTRRVRTYERRIKRLERSIGRYERRLDRIQSRLGNDTESSQDQQDVVPTLAPTIPDVTDLESEEPTPPAAIPVPTDLPPTTAPPLVDDETESPPTPSTSEEEELEPDTPAIIVTIPGIELPGIPGGEPDVDTPDPQEEQPVTPPTTGGDESNLLMVADFEEGKVDGCSTRLWPCGDTSGSCGCSEGTSLAIVNRSEGFPTRGEYSYKATLSDCHERSEIVWTCTRASNGDEIWASFSIFIPTDFKGGSIISQFHDTMGCGGACGAEKNLPPPCPSYSRGGPTVMSFRDGKFTMSLRHELNGCVNRTSIPITGAPSGNDALGKWINVVFNARWTAASDGFLDIWVWAEGSPPPSKPNGSFNGPTLFNFTDGRSGSVNFRVGQYRGDPGKVGGGSVSVFYDEVRYGEVKQGASFADVLPTDPAYDGG